eukprot:4652173-Amphidinium_carterae.2
MHADTTALSLELLIKEPQRPFPFPCPAASSMVLRNNHAEKYTACQTLVGGGRPNRSRRAGSRASKDKSAPVQEHPRTPNMHTNNLSHEHCSLSPPACVYCSSPVLPRNRRLFAVDLEPHVLQKSFMSRDTCMDCS